MSLDIVLSREQVRSVDRLATQQFGIPSILLMENAGRSCADKLLELGVTTSGAVCICCGKGNNGGDGFVMARHLSAQGVPVEVLIFHDPEEFADDAALNLKILSRCDVSLHRLALPYDMPQLEQHLRHASWIVDALLGTGATGKLRFPYDLLIPALNRCGRPLFSIDVPSGLDCDLGKVETDAIYAQATMTLVANKPGFRSATGKSHCGEIFVGTIGIPKNLISCVHGEQEFAEIQ